MPVTVGIFAFGHDIAKEIREVKLPDLINKGIPATFDASAYQTGIFDWISKGKGSSIVRAVAGSGKTTTCVYALTYIPGVDLTKVQAVTFHSAGFSAVRRHLNGVRVNVDGYKIRNLLRDRLNMVESDLYSAFCAKLIELARGARGIGALVPDTESAWVDIINHHDLSLDSEDATESRAIEIAREAMHWADEEAEKGNIDFNDQLYLPLKWRLKLWQYDWVIIDEAQDTNPVRRALAKLSLRPGGRLIAVGDEKQSIMGFTGASVDAMDLIRREFSCIDLPLTVSYRCSKAVARRAKTLVPYFECAESAVEGSDTAKTLKDALTVLGPKDAILCRNVAPLVELAFSLIAQGRGCHVAGREIGQGLVNLIKKQKAKGIDALLTKLADYREREVAKFTAKGEEQKADSLCDRIACIEVVIHALSENDRTVPALIAKIEGLFTDTNGVLTLSTMHKSKGKEWPSVAIYRPELCPSKWARQDWQQEQEVNLLYVAWTRAKVNIIDILQDPPKA